MIRNALLLFGTAGILVVGFLGYYSLTRIDPGDNNARTTTVDRLEKNQQVSQEQKFVFPVPEGGDAQLQPGQAAEFTFFDEFTHRPKQRFGYSKWTRIPGTRNDVEVEDPSITLYRADGTTVDIAADRGQISSDSVDPRQLEAKKGLLEGNVRLSVSRPADDQGKPEPLPGVLVELDSLRFDLNLGEIHSDGNLHLTGDGFEIRGRGLDLAWNDRERRIDNLEIHQGERLELTMAGAILQGLNGPDTDSGAATQTQTPAQRPERRVTTYSCVLTGGVQVEHFRGDHHVGSLTAPELSLLFEVGDNARDMLRPKPAADGAASQPAASQAAASQPAAPRLATATTTQPTSAPASQPGPERLVVRWRGPLHLVPVESRTTRDKLRREIEARGGDVRITLGDKGAVECGRLAYHEQDRRLWIYGKDGSPVEIALPGKLQASASSIFFDRDASIVKLIGNVSLVGVSLEGKANARQSQDISQAFEPRNSDELAIRCALWAELHLREDTKPDVVGLGEDFSDVGKLDSAVFAGNVHVDMPGQTLRSHRLEATFRDVPVPAAGHGLATQPMAATDAAITSVESRPTAPDAADSIASRLQLASAVASGRVRLASGNQQLRCTWMHVDFEQDAHNKPKPRAMDARGAVMLDDTDSRVFARGRRVTAEMSLDGHVDHARVTGDTSRPATAEAQDYTIRSKRIDLELGRAEDDPRGHEPFHLHMPGQSLLEFTTDRGLQGLRRGPASLIRVTCNEHMAFDSDADTNQVSFVGNVIVRDGNDRLESQRLTLYLVDESTAADAGAGEEDWVRALPDTVRLGARLPRALRNVWRAMRGAPRELFASHTPGERIHKEPLRMVAHQAALISETYDPDRHRPIVMQRIDAPELTVEIPQRTVRTIGETVLGMTSLRLGGGEPEEADVLGLPSAMITKGPSQTAMSAGRAMTYVFGDGGPDSRDSVLFEGGVKFVHAAGKRMKDLHELLPELDANPTARAQLQDRATRLFCDRVELLLDVAQTPDGRQRSPRMTWMNARGNVYLVDQQGAENRAVTAEQIEFDRSEQTVRVFGDKVMNMPAKIETWNPVKNSYERPVVGPSFVIHLDTNTVQAEHVSGELRR